MGNEQDPTERLENDQKPKKSKTTSIKAESKLNKKLIEDNENLRSSVERLTEDNIYLKGNNDTLIGDNGSLIKNNSALVESNKGLTSSVERMVENNTGLKSSIDEVAETNKNLSSTISRLTGSNDSLAKSYEILAEKGNAGPSNLDKVIEVTTKLNSSIDTLTKDSAGLRYDLEKSKKNYESLKVDNSCLQVEVTRKQRKIGVRNKIITGLTALTLVFGGLASWFGYQHNSQKNQKENAESIQLIERDNTIGSLEKELQTGKERVELLNTELESAKQDYDKLKQDYDSVNTSLQEKESVSKELRKEYTSLVGRLEDTEKRANSLEQELQEGKERVESLNAELESARGNYDKLKQERDSLSERLASIPTEPKYSFINMGDCKYELTSEDAKTEGLDMPYKYDRMMIFNDYVVLSENESVVKIYSRDGIDKPVSFEKLGLKVLPDSELITQDKGLFEFISNLEKE